MPSEHAAKEKHKPAFRRMVSDLSKGTVLKPLLQAYLFDARFPDFTIDFRKIGVRRPDGWFHPSEHPLMSERMLYWYLVDPEGWHVQPKEYMGTLSVTIGTVMHEFMRMCLWDLGVALTVDEMRDEGWHVPPGRTEAHVRDEETGARGSMDGILKITIPSALDLTRQHFEFKTTNPNKLAKIPDLDLEAFKRLFPDYYAQSQEYLRMSGLRLTVLIFMAMGYPWPMAEVHIPYDPFFSEDLRQKYLRVRRAVADAAGGDRLGNMPMPCCAPGSKDAAVCPARLVCPNGAMLR